MCDMCGDGDNTKDFKSAPSTPERMKEIEDRTLATIIEHGHQVMGIFDNEGGPNFAYSLGRCVDDSPEFLVTGSLPMRVMQYMINEAARLHDDGTPVADGYEFPPDALLADFPVRVVAADSEAAKMNMTRSIFGPDFEALQLLWPDREGNWPDSPEWDDRFAQPIFRKRVSS